MLRKISILISKFIFVVSIPLSFGVDAYYDFDIQDSDPGYLVALLSYLYLSCFLAVLLARWINIISNLFIRIILFILVWVIPINLLGTPKSPDGSFVDSMSFVVCLTLLFCGGIILIRWLTTLIAPFVSKKLKLETGVNGKINWVNWFMVSWIFVYLAGVIAAPILRPNIGYEDPRMQSYLWLLFQLNVVIIALVYMLRRDLPRK